MPAEAISVIEGNMEFMRPSELIPQIQAAFPGVTATQVHTVWRERSKVYWWRAEQQLLSAELLLAEYGNEIDLFSVAGVPDGVEMVAWGMKKIAVPLKGQGVEIGMDATCESQRQSSYCGSLIDAQITRTRNIWSCTALW